MPAPAVFVDAFAGGSWKSPDAALAKWLKKHPITTAIYQADWHWKLGAGEVKRAELAVFTPTPDGRTHLVVKGTGESSVALDSRPVGFSLLRDMALALLNQPLPAGTMPGPAQWIGEVRYCDTFFEMTANPRRHAVPRADMTGRELGQPIHALLAPQADNKLHVHPLPPAKEQNVRRHVMPPDASHLPLVAVLDLTMMGSAKDAIAFTPTHAFVCNGGQRMAFDWAEVRDVAPVDDSTVRVRLAERGWIALACGRHARTLYALFQQLAQIPARTESSSTLGLPPPFQMSSGQS
jgi:hypothetical protein